MEGRILRRFNVGSLPILAVGLALVLGGCASSGNSVEIPSGAVATGDAISLFNGTDLTGWNGDPRFWRVENGTIVAQTTENNTIQQNSFLIWDGGTVDDFHLSMEFRMTGGNSGVQYRSIVNQGWSVRGYQADFDSGNRYVGMLYDEGGRGIVARRSEQVVIEPDGTFNVVGQVGDPEELTAAINPAEWTRIEITAIGNHLVHKINGRTTVDVVDNQVEEREMSGILALQVHTGPPMKVEYRNIQLTPLSPTTAAR
jgi:hypothetical protein